MEERLYHRLQSVFHKFINEKIDTIYLYPFGNRGSQIYNFIKCRYGFMKIVVVDNELSKYNPNVLRFSEMEKNVQLENSSILLTSDNPMIYRELRIKVYKNIPREKVIDCFLENPLVYSGDYRLAALALASKQIYANQVEGCVAEAGVYQGDFAKYLNVLFPERKLYLFDTFCGFEPTQVDDKMDNLEQTEQWINRLKDTTIDIVLEKMQYKEQVIIKKGLFPNSGKNINEKFAFVNLDMDIYKPTYEGLLYFWEKMSKGGYMFIHDFDNWDGIRAAVIQFCEKKETSYVCLNDRRTVCIAKSMS